MRLAFAPPSSLGSPRAGRCLGFRNNLAAAFMGGHPFEVVSGRALEKMTRGPTGQYGRCTDGTSSTTGAAARGFTLAKPVSLAGSWTTFALVRGEGDPASYQMGLWREGAVSQGTTYCIFGNNANSRRPRLRVNATDVIVYSGPILPITGELSLVAFRWINGSQGSVWVNGALQVSASSSATSDSAATIKNVGYQYGTEEVIGRIYGFAHFAAALPDAAVAKLTSSPALFMRSVFEL